MSTATILVVEDEPLVGLEIQEDLIHLGYRVPQVVTHGEEVQNAMDVYQPDLVLMDIRLAGTMDGIQAAAKLKETSDVPVLFLTAYSDSTTLGRAAQVLPDGYLLKPLGERDLAVNVELVLLKAQSGVAKKKLPKTPPPQDGDRQSVNQTIQDLLPLDGVYGHRLESAGFLIPSASGTGDFYDVFPLGPYHFVFYSLDVEGHGNLPAMLAFTLRTLIRDLAGIYVKRHNAIPSPSALLEALNDKFAPRAAGALFFSVTMGILAPGTGEFQLVRAGHTKTLWMREGGIVQWLQGTGSALGIFHEIHLEELSGRLQEGDRLVLCSDGVVETLGRRDLDRGYAELARLFQENSSLGVADLAKVVQTRCLAVPEDHRDDMSLLIVGPMLW